MKNYFKLLSCCLLTSAAWTMISCDSDDYLDGTDTVGNAVEEANEFNYSNTQEVDLTVDYTDFKTYGSVRFGIYDRNPFVSDNEVNPYYLDANIDPIFESYTNEKGLFDATIALPAYAKVLYIVTGDLFVSEKSMKVEVVDGVAKAIAKNNGSLAAKAPRRVQGITGVSTNDMTNFYNLSYKVSGKEKANNWPSTGEQVYKDWVTPLGTWNSATGYPDYILPSTTENINKGLVFTDSELQGLFDASKKALSSTSTCSEQYRKQSDLTLIKDAEISIVLLGGNTCWCSTLGYYYYTDATKPKSLMEVNPIMLIPNTMNGKWTADKKCDYKNNIGINDGDAIQLKYYPNIANGDLSGETTLFPRGTKIGFILKTQGWGMQGKDYCIQNSSTGWTTIRPYNVWAASTDGLSSCSTMPGIGIGNYLNPNGDARTAKFGYTSTNGTDYAIIGFEDACNDLNYSDVIFAVNPANVFTTMPKVEQGKTTISGVYAFEDLWPNRGDYDMNDVLIDSKHEMTYNSSGNITKQVFRLKTYQNKVEKISGLALKLNTKKTPSSIVMKKMDRNSSTQKTVTFSKDTQEGFYYLTDNITSELGSTYIFELTYSSGIPIKDVAEIEPFIWRDETDAEGNTKRWEVHLPGYAPTQKIDMSYFGTGEDASNPSQNRWYVRPGLYPFAFYLANASASMFEDTILKTENESEPISDFYPGFIKWATSKGAESSDWYLYPRK